MNKIEPAKRKQEIRRMSYRNCGKIPQCKTSPDKIAPWKLPSPCKLFPEKIPASENPPSPNRKMYAYLPTAGVVYSVSKGKFCNLKTFSLGAMGVAGGHEYLKRYSLFGLSTKLNKMAISKFWSDDFEKKGAWEGT